MSAIYAIIHRPSRLIYVGSTTKDPRRRVHQHMGTLRCGKHCNKAFQATFTGCLDDYGWAVVAAPPRRFNLPLERHYQRLHKWHASRERVYGAVLGPNVVGAYAPFHYQETFICRLKRMLAAKPVEAHALSRLASDPYCSDWLPISMNALPKPRRRLVAR